MNYRPLEEGEIVQVGDEVRSSTTGHPDNWYPACTSLGCRCVNGYITNHNFLIARRPLLPGNETIIPKKEVSGKTVNGWSSWNNSTS
jgi:hypothetical protein